MLGMFIRCTYDGFKQLDATDYKVLTPLDNVRNMLKPTLDKKIGGK